jgi:hypothetical protein
VVSPWQGMMLEGELRKSGAVWSAAIAIDRHAAMRRYFDKQGMLSLEPNDNMRNFVDQKLIKIRRVDKERNKKELIKTNNWNCEVSISLRELLGCYTLVLGPALNFSVIFN